MKQYTSLLAALEDFQDKQCFLFDMDGLLFDSEQLFMEQLAAVMADRGYHLTREIYVRTLGMGGEPLRNYMQGIYGQSYPFEECGQEAGRRVLQIAEHVGLRIKPQIVEALEMLQRHHKQCAVASSTNSGHVRKYLEIANLMPYFSVIMGGDLVSAAKPNPEIFLTAAARCGMKPEDTVVLEDSENGIRAAHAAGMGTICVPDLVQPSAEIHPWIDALVR
ncbi:MAG: HAD family phosphatase [Lachnospiraceae bacterium]|nr:HAD family phosphatase [Lachnospiraceae bacterium]